MGTRTEATFSLASESHLLELCGVANAHLNLIERLLRVTIYHKTQSFRIIGEHASEAQQLICDVHEKLEAGTLNVAHIEQTILQSQQKPHELCEFNKEAHTIHTPKRTITAANKNQCDFIAAMRSKPLVFGLGPAGVGKTFLAVAQAVCHLHYGVVEKIILTRPAVEAGEQLGFLPGDIAQKTDPYMRPLYDALYATLGQEMHDLMTKKVIEVAPLAFMRGRTLDNACIILDEAQNTTIAQMYMLLTRLGLESKMCIIGDESQVDIKEPSGLSHAAQLLAQHKVPEVDICRFNAQDVMRHPLVQAIIQAYNAQNNNNDAQ